MFVSHLIRDHRSAFAATMRRYGVSIDQVGDGTSWGEVYDLSIAALEDTTTQLFAAYQGWAFPASYPEIVQIASAASDRRKAEEMMPWTIGRRNRDRAQRQVSEADVQRAKARLRRSSAMRGLDGFDV